MKDYERVKSVLASMDGVVIGYSGGVDSTLVARAADEALGERALSVLRGLGLRQSRVRHHGPIARIEASADDMSVFADGNARERAVSELKTLGYLYVALDLEGYRTGSMNETLRIGG